MIHRRDPTAAASLMRQLITAAETAVDTSGGTIAKRPHARQSEFLKLDCEEALYGGAAGGGKTEALLMWLAEGVRHPKYSGLFLRRTKPRLWRSTDSPILRSHELYEPLGGHRSDLQWRFPSGAVIEFGYCQYDKDVHSYHGPSYQRIAWDELTEFTEYQYSYLFSRMRKHSDFNISCGCRAGSNPGNIGHLWVRKRFVTREAEAAVAKLGIYDPSPPGMVFWNQDRAYVPARVPDNPTLDVADYVERLRTKLSPVLRARLLNGDWSVAEDAVIRADWLRYFGEGTSRYALEPLGADGSPLSCGLIDDRQLRRFATIDTAGTSRERAREVQGKPRSWSVVAIWDAGGPAREPWLFLRHVWRDRVGWQDLVRGTQTTLTDWGVGRVIVENAHFGPALAEELKAPADPAAPRFNVEMFNPQMRMLKGQGADGMPGKLERSAELQRMLEAGRVFLPLGETTWLPELEDEWLAWTGHPDETADQIDVASMAAWECVQPGTRVPMEALRLEVPAALGNWGAGVRSPRG